MTDRQTALLYPLAVAAVGWARPSMALRPVRLWTAGSNQKMTGRERSLHGHPGSPSRALQTVLNGLPLAQLREEATHLQVVGGSSRGLPRGYLHTNHAICRGFPERFAMARQTTMSGGAGVLATCLIRSLGKAQPEIPPRPGWPAAGERYPSNRNAVQYRAVNASSVSLHASFLASPRPPRVAGLGR
jgi:hypothetical protein